MSEVIEATANEEELVTPISVFQHAEKLIMKYREKLFATAFAIAKARDPSKPVCTVEDFEAADKKMRPGADISE